MNKRAGFRTCAAAVVVFTLTVLPASGSHGDGTIGNEDYSPLIETFAPPPYPNQPANLRLVVVQADHEMPVIDVRHRMPLEWGFAPETLRPAEKADQTAAETCQDIMANYGGANFDQDNNPADVRRAEHIGTVSFRANTTTTRTEIVDTRPPSNVTSGPTGPSPAQNTPHLTFTGLIAFRDWEEALQRANLCVYAYARDGRADEPIDPEPLAEETPDGTPSVSATYDRTPREHLFPASLTRTGTAWELRFDLRSFYTNSFLAAEDLSITNAAVHLGGFSSGRWQANCAPGRQCNSFEEEAAKARAARVVFSRAPESAGSYELQSVLTGCEPNALSEPVPCKQDTERVVTIALPFQIAPPGGPVHEFARIVSPMPFSVHRGADTVEVRWDQPPVAFGDRIKGYLVTVARPHEQDSRHFDYVISEPLARLSAGLPHSTNPCGPSGDEPQCSLELTFPMMSEAGRLLPHDQKYVVSLVTIYSDGHRTDGRCDDGTPEGATCSPAEGGFVRALPGLDSREFFLTYEAWPLAYQESSTRNVLFVDFNTQRAMFLWWSRGDNRNVLYDDWTRNVQGMNGAGGSIVISGRDVGNRNHVFVGLAAVANAVGDLWLSDLRHFPGSPTGLPTFERRTFSGARVS